MTVFYRIPVIYVTEHAYYKIILELLSQHDKLNKKNLFRNQQLGKKLE